MGGEISYDEIMRQVDLRRRELINDAAVTLEQANERIRQLEHLNATLAAEIDLQRPVITAVHGYRESDQYGWDNRVTLQVVRDAYRAYEAAKEGGE